MEGYGEEYKKNVGYKGNDNPTKPSQLDEGTIKGNDSQIKPGATSGYPMSGFEKDHIETGAGTKPTPKT